MTPRLFWMRLAPSAWLITTASCAASLPPPAAPPRLILPGEATTPCVLPRLPETPTLGDLEVVYAERGARLVACEGARRLAVETLLAERALQDQWTREAAPRRRWFPFR